MQTRFAAVALAACLLSACDPMPTVTPTATVPDTPSATLLPSEPPPTPSPAPTMALMQEEDIARVDLLDERPTAVCDENPNLPFIDAPEPWTCYNGLQLGFRALRTRMPSINRLYLHRRPCAALPCTQSELDTVDVIGWLGDDAFSVTITEEPFTLTVPFAGAIAPWPSASSSVPPPVARPPIEGSSSEIRSREPYPYCGRERPHDSGQPAERKLEINRCFIDAVLEGRPAEMVLIPDVIREPVVIRFDGRGVVAWSTRRSGWETWTCVTLGNSVYVGQAC